MKNFNLEQTCAKENTLYPTLRDEYFVVYLAGGKGTELSLVYLEFTMYFCIDNKHIIDPFVDDWKNSPTVSLVYFQRQLQSKEGTLGKPGCTT